MTDTAPAARPVLEPAAQAFVEATANPPYLYDLTPDEARKVLDDVQATPIDKPAADDQWVTVPAEVGDVRVRIVRPQGATHTLPVILYMHGGAFLTCGVNSHNRIVTTLSTAADAPVLVVNYRMIPKHTVGMAVDDCRDA